MRAFTMYRRDMSNAPHTAEQKNDPDKPQFEGVVFSDGRVAIRWLTAKGSTACWDSMEDMLAIHGHPEYGSEIAWHDVVKGKAAALAGGSEGASAVDPNIVYPGKDLTNTFPQEE